MSGSVVKEVAQRLSHRLIQTAADNRDERRRGHHPAEPGKYEGVSMALHVAVKAASALQIEPSR